MKWFLFNFNFGKIIHKNYQLTLKDLIETINILFDMCTMFSSVCLLYTMWHPMISALFYWPRPENWNNHPKVRWLLLTIPIKLNGPKHTVVQRPEKCWPNVYNGTNPPSRLIRRDNLRASAYVLWKRQKARKDFNVGGSDLCTGPAALAFRVPNVCVCVPALFTSRVQMIEWNYQCVDLPV